MEPEKSESAYDQYNRLQYRVPKAELDKLFGVGDEKLVGHGIASKVQVEYYAPIFRLEDHESVGMTRRTRGRKLNDIANEVIELLGDELIDEYLDQFRYDDKLPPESEWPDDVRWVAVFPVTGAEGQHYVHVELIRQDGSRNTFMLGKTLLGMEHAKAMCSKLIDVFGC